MVVSDIPTLAVRALTWVAESLALAIAGCSQGPLASVWMMDALQIQHERDERLCNFWIPLSEEDRARNPVIRNEIARRGLTCGGAFDGAAQGYSGDPSSAGTPANLVAATTNVNMRAGPGTSHAVRGLLQAGQSVTLIRQDGAWCECETGDGLRVFVFCRYLDLSGVGGPSIQQADGGGPSLPSLREGATYRAVRSQLRAAGWSPVRVPGGECDTARCEGFEETVFCAGTGRAVCLYSWRQEDAYLLVRAWGEGEQQYDSAELCSAVNARADGGDWCSPYADRALPQGLGQAAITLLGPNLLVQNTDGTSTLVEIGASSAFAREVISRSLGRPLEAGQMDFDCGAGATHWARWQELMVFFTDGELTGWDITSPRFRTREGIRVGSTLRELRAAFPDVQFYDHTTGRVWHVENLYGFIDSSNQVARIRSGVNCDAH